MVPHAHSSDGVWPLDAGRRVKPALFKRPGEKRADLRATGRAGPPTAGRAIRSRRAGEQKRQRRATVRLIAIGRPTGAE